VAAAGTGDGRGGMAAGGGPWWLTDRPAVLLLAVTAAASVLSVAVSQIALGATLAWCLWLQLRGRPVWVRTGLEWPAAALLLWALAVLPLSTDVGSSLLHSRRFYLFTALWLGAALAGTDRRRRLLAIALLVGASVDAVVSIVFQAWLPGRWDARLPLLQHSTITGAWLMMGAALLAVGWLLAGRGRRRWWSLVPLATAMTAVLLTRTRSAWMGLAAGLVLLVLAAGWRKRLLLMAALVLAILLGPAPLRERTATIVDPSYRTNSQRIDLWRTGWELVRQRPLLGVGDRDLREFTPGVVRYDGGRHVVHMPHLHQNFVMLAVIWGIPGLLLGTWLLLAMGRRLWGAMRSARRAGREVPLAWALGGWGLWVAVMVAGLFDWTFGDQELSLLLMLVVGIALAPDRSSAGPVQA